MAYASFILCAGIPQWMGGSQHGCIHQHRQWLLRTYDENLVNFYPVTTEFCRLVRAGRDTRWSLSRISSIFLRASVVGNNLSSNRQHPSNGCLDDKQRLSELFCAVLCTKVVHSDTHTDQVYMGLKSKNPFAAVRGGKTAMRPFVQIFFDHLLLLLFLLLLLLVIRLLCVQVPLWCQHC